MSILRVCADTDSGDVRVIDAATFAVVARYTAGRQLRLVSGVPARGHNLPYNRQHRDENLGSSPLWGGW